MHMSRLFCNFVVPKLKIILTRSCARHEPVQNIMKKHLAEAVCKIIDQIIILKKEYSDQWPSYVTERNEDGEWNVTVTFPYLSEMLRITTLLEDFSTYQIQTLSNYKIRIS